MVKYLSYYMSKVTDPKATYTVNIKSEISKYKRKNPDVLKPMIIFDFIGTIPLLFRGYEEVKFGGRHGECIRRAQNIFQTFRDLNVELVFFLDGPIKEMKFSEWCRRKNLEYEHQKKLFKNLKAQEPISYHFDKYLQTYYENYLRVAKKFGRVFISFHNECDLDLAEFAARMKPLAVIAYDSDFLIMPGDFPLWLPLTLNLRKLTVDVWNKYMLRESLGLKQWQMPILATLSGNDWIHYTHVEHIRKRLIEKEKSDDVVVIEKSLAKLITDKFKTCKDLDIRLIDMISNEGKAEIPTNEIARLVKISLDFYDYNSHTVTRIEPDWLRDHISQTASFAVFSLLKQFTLRIPQTFIDSFAGDSKPYSDLVLPILRRQLGIFYRNRENSEKNVNCSFALKPSHNEPFGIYKFPPLYPEFEVPEIDDILSDDEDIVSVEKRVELLYWVLSTKRKPLGKKWILKLLETTLLIPALICNYLLMERQITIDEADTLLLSLYEASRMDSNKSASIKPPEIILGRPFWLAFTYTHLVRHFEDTVTICGLHKYISNSYFDGYVFHKMYGKFLKMSFDERKAITQSILDYRLYAI